MLNVADRDVNREKQDLANRLEELIDLFEIDAKKNKNIKRILKDL